MFPRITQYAHQLLQSRIKVGDWVIDATMGNGHDTLFLAQLVGEVGKVYAFDIQTQALHNTNELLETYNLRHRVELFQQSHDRLHFPLSSIAAVVFNLGYLPGSDKTIATMPETTLKAIENSLELLKVGGLVVLTIYWGHEQGQLEKEAVEKYVEGLSYPEYMVLRYQYVNPKNNPPFILAIERRK
ncbi:class I SAM-dependent methyltransferase [Ammoniphilus sp. CFH 90114]|uniref:class I SAM-dependent methyltransferase n=1 Tax=Ammoniphilus sp. CFH 90114 TaxID=2493665 RepID=UPI00100E2B2B|nr:class I SAM-dependent methyltransferase [Ammoniphilus sp. CFH 90114]RXT15193.1 methyltransferase domain-containing protein [Ammoniphilus sp. CFH 90114]